MRSVIACVLVLKIASCYGQFARTCSGDIEIAFFSATKNFNDARTSCRNYGGDLIKIGNSDIQTAIKNAITVKPIYYIGAQDINGDNRYNWVVDGSVIGANPLLPSTGTSTAYQNWNFNQPNMVSENCVILGEHNVYSWTDTVCSLKYRYICQKDLIRLSNTGHIATCQSPISTVGMRWLRNSVIVESSDKGRVYQTIGRSSATLHYANANVTEAGTYTCETTNPSCSATKTYAVTVDGTPTIQSVVGNKCNASLFVTWKPNKSAVGFVHRYKVSGANVSSYAVPSSIDPVSTEITDLQFSTSYTVQIQVCETEDSCTTSFIATSGGITDGVTDPVANATFEYSDGCKATWKSSDNSATYTVETKCTVDQYREGEEVQSSTKKSKNLETTTFQFQPRGNRVCSATIWAKGCGAFSKPMEATGFCRTPPKEPENIELPAIESSSASKTIQMSKPSEDNGLISCIFIVLCYNKCSETQFTVQDLEKASQTNVTSNTDQQVSSIALAISMASVSRNQISRQLAQGEVTSCNLYNTGMVAVRSLSKVIEGNNVIDNSARNVWAYAVTSTPSGGRILLQSSNPIIVLKGENAGTTLNIGLIIGLIVGLIAIIIIIAVVVIIVKRKQTDTQKNSTSNSNSQIESGNRVVMAQTQDTSPYAYENEPAGQEYEEIKSSERQRIQSRQQNQRTTCQTRTTESLTMAPQHGQTDSPYLNEPSNPAYEEIN